MVILFILFVVQFSIACACLAVGTEQQSELAKKGWDNASKQTQQSAQTYFNCCGYATTKTLNITDCPNVSSNPTFDYLIHILNTILGQMLYRF